MKKLITIVALFALAVPAAFAAPPPGKGNQGGKKGAEASGSAGVVVASSAKTCKELRKTMGVADFRAAYGTGNGKNAMGKCVSREVQSSTTDAKNAAKECKAERAADPAAFKEKYGTNPNKANALGKCVSALAKESAEDRQDAVENAAKSCKAERAANPAAFKEKYGTNANKANAFGRCVSELAKGA